MNPITPILKPGRQVLVSISDEPALIEATVAEVFPYQELLRVNIGEGNEVVVRFSQVIQ